jgi:hypothetical protein
MGHAGLCDEEISDGLTFVQLSNGVVLTKRMAKEMGIIPRSNEATATAEPAPGTVSEAGRDTQQGNDGERAGHEDRRDEVTGQEQREC